MTDYTVTVHAAQQSDNSPVGHMWFDLNANDGGTVTKNSYGFYPRDGTPYDEGLVVNNDSLLDYPLGTTRSKTITISKAHYDAMKAYGDNPKQNGFDTDTYSAPNNSCVDFTWRGLEFGGLNPNKFQGDMFPGNNWDDMDQIGDPNNPPGSPPPTTDDGGNVWDLPFPVEPINWVLPPAVIDPLVIDLDGNYGDSTFRNYGDKNTVTVHLIQIRCKRTQNHLPGICILSVVGRLRNSCRLPADFSLGVQ